MIYLIITTSINNRFGLTDSTARQEQYLSAIRETLQHLPKSITPIIVENNGKRDTYLDHFVHGSKPVRVIYTTNNYIRCNNKSTIEMMDVKDVIREGNIQENDTIIKLTGRYQITSPDFFMEVIQHEKQVDAFVKFFNVCTQTFEENNCILGCFAIRTCHISLYPHWSLDSYSSAEVAFATYVRRSLGMIREIKNIGMKCVFADNGYTLHV
jgi:hypothetical protein